MPSCKKLLTGRRLPTPGLENNIITLKFKELLEPQRSPLWNILSLNLPQNSTQF